MPLTKTQAAALYWARKNHHVTLRGRRGGAHAGSDRGIYPNNRGVRQNGGGAYRRMIERMAADGLLTKSWPFHITGAGREALAEFETRYWWAETGRYWMAKARHEC